MEAILSRLLAQQPQTRLVLKFIFVVLTLLGIMAALAPPGEVSYSHADKVLHTGGSFGLVMMLDLATNRSFWRWQVPLIASYGALIEILQSLTSWRTFSVADFIADVVGILLYWALWKILLQRIIPHDNG